MKNKKIVVTGDICLNSLISKEIIGKENNFFYEKFPKVNVTKTLGGALLMTKLVRLATNLIKKLDFNLKNVLTNYI